MLTLRMLFRSPVTLATLFLLPLGLASGVNSPPSRQRIVVKLRAPIADTLQAAMAANSMSLTRSSATSPDVQGFLHTYAAQSLTPVYPHLLAAKLQTGQSDRQMAEAVQRRFAKRAGRLRGAFAPPDISATYVLELEPGQDKDRVLGQMRADPRVEFAEPDQKFSVNIVPNDPYFSASGTWGQVYDDLWGIKKVNAPAAWDTTNGQGIVVAVVDTGIDYNHPDIQPNLWSNSGEIAGNGIDDDGDGYVDDVRGWNFAYDRNDPFDDNGHGTHVAGTIAAVGNNRIGVVGVAWGAQVMAVKILDASGSCEEATCAKGVVYAADHGADVINLSWGGNAPSQVIADAIDYAHSLGAVIVASAGNDDADVTGETPACLWDVIAVAATDYKDVPASFSNWGTRIDVAAPGIDILSLRAAGSTLGTPVGDGYMRLDGTSMAAPHVSGLAALLLAAHPEFSNEDVRQALRVSADHSDPAGGPTYFGYGRANATAALGVSGVLEAKISTPTEGTLAVSPLTISGVARGNDFASYTLSYGQYPFGPDFVTFQTGTAGASGELGVFDPAIANCMDCAIRLTVYNTAGQAFTDQTRVSTSNALLSSPAGGYSQAADTYKPGATVQITGTAERAGFQNYQIQWAPGLGPDTGWSSDGLTLASGGTSPVANGLLATWRTSPNLSAGYYTVTLTVNGSGGAGGVIITTATVYLEPDLMSTNWPQGLPGAPAQGPGAVAAMNADGSMRLMLAQEDFNDTGGALWTLPIDGQARQTMLPGSGSWTQPAVASLDGGPADQVVTGEWTSTEVFRPNGIDFSTIQPSPASYFYAAQPQITHLSSNDEWDILSVGQDPPNSSAYLFAWRPDGTPAGANFPIQLLDRNDMHWAYSGTRCIVADLDGDGQNEVVTLEGLTQFTYALRRFHADGSPDPWLAPIQNGQPRAMAAADLDRNGGVETIIASTLGDRLFVTVFQPDGSTRSGWPVPMLVDITWDHQVFLSIADLNRDGTEQIIVCDEGHIYVFNSDGTPYTPGWPVAVDDIWSAFGAVVVGDIDGDGAPEIVTTQWGLYDMRLLAYHRDGTLARSWTLTGRNGLLPTPLAGIVIGDFNQDGITDIAVSYGTGSGRLVGGVVTILSTGAPFNPTASDWTMMYQNPRNTAVFGSWKPFKCWGGECGKAPRKGGGSGGKDPGLGEPVRHR